MGILSRTQRIFAAVAAGMVVGGIVSASAASLGSANVEPVGTTAGGVASCDTDGITVSWPTSTIVYVPTDGEYEYSAIQLSNVNTACDGSDYSISVTTGTSTLLKTQSGTGITFPSGTATITLTGGGVPVKAAATTRVAVILSGTP